MASLAVNEVRALLSQHLQSYKAGATAPQIVAAFRTMHARSIAKASAELENIALTKLLHEVGSRAPTPVSGQHDLFAGYGVPDTIVVPGAGSTKPKIHKPLEEVTIREVEIWVETHSRPKIDLSPRVSEVSRLLNQIKPYAENDQIIVREALRLCLEHKQGKVA